MKKSHKILLGVLSFVLIISVLLIIKNIQAQDENIPGMPFGVTPENVEGYQQKIENPDEGTAYLKQECEIHPEQNPKL